MVGARRLSSDDGRCSTFLLNVFQYLGLYGGKSHKTTVFIFFSMRNSDPVD
jgi:hypothetical protein